ncbi:MAG: Tic20 family protein, partial [Microcystaceae cyanobacterium]
YLPIAPLLKFYYQFPFASFIIFLVLFFAVVRNDQISHFVRFNAMQAILIGILLSLFGLIMQYVFNNLGIPLLTETLYNFAFLGTLAASGYSIVRSALGRYAEMPTISEAAYSQVRF